MAVNSLIILIIISSSFIPFINCSINLLYLSLYPSLFATILRWLIHSSVFSFCSLINLQHCNEKIVSLCWHLNYSFNTLSNSMLVLHFSCHSSFKSVQILLSLTNTILSGPSCFPVCCSYYSWKCSLPLFHNFHISWCLSATLQLKWGCFSARTPDPSTVSAGLASSQHNK